MMYSVERQTPRIMHPACHDRYLIVERRSRHTLSDSRGLGQLTIFCSFRLASNINLQINLNSPTATGDYVCTDTSGKFTFAAYC